MELDDLKYKNRFPQSVDSSNTYQISETDIKEMTSQRSCYLIGDIQQRLKKDRTHGYILLAILAVFAALEYDSFWFYYFLGGILFSVRLLVVLIKLQKRVDQACSTNEPVAARLMEIHTLISYYIKFYKTANRVAYFVVVIAITLKYWPTPFTNFAFLPSLLLKCLLLAFVQYIIVRYFTRKYLKKYDDILIDIHYHLAEIRSA